MRLAKKFEQFVAGSVNGRRLFQHLSVERNDLMGTNDERSRNTRICLLDPCSWKQLSYISGISLPDSLEQCLIWRALLEVQRQGTASPDAASSLARLPISDARTRSFLIGPSIRLAPLSIMAAHFHVRGGRSTIGSMGSAGSQGNRTSLADISLHIMKVAPTCAAKLGYRKASATV
jgi:hypothetical protein